MTNWRTCGFKWESGNICEEEFHTCMHPVKHTGPHYCGSCGEQLRVGASWEIGSSIDHRTGERKKRAAPRAKGEQADGQ